RGTDFMAGYSRSTNISTVVTFEGSVAFGQPGPNGAILNPVVVTPGLMTEMSGNQAPPAPKPVPPQQLAVMDQETNADTAGRPAPPSNEPRTPAAEEKKDGQKEAPKGQQPGAS